MKKFNLLPILLVFAVLIGVSITVILWPEKSEVDPFAEIIDELNATVEVIDKSSVNLNKILLKTRAGMIGNAKAFGAMIAELKGHLESMDYIMDSNNLEEYESLFNFNDDTKAKANQKISLSTQFSQRHSQYKYAVNSAREQGDQVAQAIVESGNFDAFKFLDLTYELAGALNDWVHFNQEEEYSFIMANAQRLTELSNYLDEEQYKPVYGFVLNLETAVKEQMVIDKLLDEVISLKVVNYYSLEKAVDEAFYTDKDEAGRVYSLMSIIITLVIAALTNGFLSLWVWLSYKKANAERQYLRAKSANLLSRARKYITNMGESLQMPVDTFKHYKKLHSIATNIVDLRRGDDIFDEQETEDMISKLVENYEAQSRKMSDKELNRTMVGCTNELDEYDEFVLEISKSKFEWESPLASLYDRMKKANKIDDEEIADIKPKQQDDTSSKLFSI